MSVTQVALLLSAVAVVFAAVFTTVRGLALFRQLRESSRALGVGLAHLADVTDSTARKTEALARESAELSSALARLESSRARLRILAAAWRDVRGLATRVTAVVPRK